MLETVLDSFRRLQAESDLVIVEGAGSPAETNLRKGDIANMGFARPANVPVVLIGDIDRGHVIAALAGARTVLEAEDRAMIHGFIINKFRGDPTLFADGRAEITRLTGWRDLGMVPWLPVVRKLPAEDAVVLDPHRATNGKGVKIVVPMLSRIANFDDFDPLQSERGVDFSFVRPGTAIPGDADLVILPGTKATLGDLAFLRAQGWDVDIAAHVRRGGRVLGICGGFQMLGKTVADPDGVEGKPETAPGLGLLDIETVLTDDKVLKPASGKLTESGAAFDGYEIHVGRTTGTATARPFLHIGDTPDGAVSADGRIAGTYIHGLFNHGEARAALLSTFGVAATGGHHGATVDGLLDELAAAMDQALDIPALSNIAGLS
jgi:adenosylcobyric acid synthase